MPNKRSKICRNCRFYNDEECNNKNFVDGCNNMPDNGLQYGGYDGYGDFCRVGPEFGCIHFERKREDLI